jgi:hypothetical protein
MDKTLVAHVVGEAVVILGVTFYLSRQNKALAHHVADLIKTVEEQKERISRLEQLNPNALTDESGKQAQFMAATVAKINEHDQLLTALMRQQEALRSLVAPQAPRPSQSSQQPQQHPQVQQHPQQPQVTQQVQQHPQLSQQLPQQVPQQVQQHPQQRQAQIPLPAAPLPKPSRTGARTTERKVSFADTVNLPSKSGGYVPSLGNPQQYQGHTHTQTQTQNQVNMGISPEELLHQASGTHQGTPQGNQEQVTSVHDLPDDDDKEDLDAELQEEYQKLEMSRRTQGYEEGNGQGSFQGNEQATGQGNAPPTTSDGLEFPDLSTKGRKK